MRTPYVCQVGPGPSAVLTRKSDPLCLVLNRIHPRGDPEVEVKMSGPRPGDLRFHSEKLSSYDR